MNEFTHDDLNMACDLVLGFCILAALVILAAFGTLVFLIGQPIIDQVVWAMHAAFSFIGGN